MPNGHILKWNILHSFTCIQALQSFEILIEILQTSTGQSLIPKARLALQRELCEGGPTLSPAQSCIPTVYKDWVLESVHQKFMNK